MPIYVMESTEINMNDLKLIESNETKTLEWFLNQELVAHITIELKARPKAHGFKYFYGFGVEPKYRRHGIGTKIMLYCMDKYNIGALHVNQTNKNAIKFYEKLGFKITSDPYPEPPEHTDEKLFWMIKSN